MRFTILLGTLAAFMAIQYLEGSERTEMVRLFTNRLVSQHILANH